DEWQIVYGQALQLGRALGGAPQLLEVISPNHPANGDRTGEEKPMTTSTSRPPNARELSNRALISEITGKASLLVKKEIELAKAEIRADLNAQLGMVKALGIAALSGVNMMRVAGVLALGLTLPSWLAALIVGGTLLVVAAILGYIGWKRMVTNPPPAHARAAHRGGD